MTPPAASVAFQVVARSARARQWNHTPSFSKAPQHLRLLLLRRKPANSHPHLKPAKSGVRNAPTASLMMPSSGIPNNATASNHRIPKTLRTRAEANAAATSANAAIVNARNKEAKPPTANRTTKTASATMEASNNRATSIRKTAAQSN